MVKFLSSTHDGEGYLVGHHRRICIMSRKTKIFLSATALLLLAGSYFLILKTAPKDASYFPIMLVLIGLDVYLWRSIRPMIKRTRQPIRIPFSFLYWLPLAILGINLLVASAFKKSYNPTSPTVIYLLGFVFTIYVCKIIPALIIVVTDVIRMLIRIIERISRSRWTENSVLESGFRAIRFTAFGIGLALFVVFVLGMIRWGYDFQIVEQHLSLADTPDAFRGFRIVQISDLHLGTWPSERKLEQVLTAVNGLSPDLVLFTGDLVNARTSEAAPYNSMLNGIHATYPVYAILGNHDYGDYASWDSPEAKEQNMKELYSIFDEVGWKVLLNAHDIIRRDGDSIAIAGVENWSVYSRFEKKGDLVRAMDGISNASMVILLTHDPSEWENEVISGHPEIDLTLAGHTHGFQFGIETKHVKWSPVQWLYEKWAGMYEHIQPDGTKQYLYVNRGLGAIGYPGRVGIRPEITLLVLE